MTKYQKLINQFQLRPIKNDEQLQQALKVIDSLILAPQSLDEDETDYLDVISDLVAKYEEKNIVFPPVPNSRMLKHLIEVKQITQSKLAQETGIAASTISDVLNNKRTLNKTHIRKLCSFFKVNKAIFDEDD